MSQVAQYFEDQEAAAELVREADPIVYRTYQFPARPDQPDILTVITVIEPGRVGTQFFMTRGHFHASPDGAEVVIGISGTGRLLLQGRDGVLATLPIAPRCLAYVPAGYAHRAVNTGEEPLVFVSLCRADVGHDYDTARRLNFRETGRQVG
ncbi:MAG: cupin domain-containing protein [Firmicutes bacterium]|nr:cupin domain-containing protein [Bacillota bacterium]